MHGSTISTILERKVCTDISAFCISEENQKSNLTSLYMRGVKSCADKNRVTWPDWNITSSDLTWSRLIETVRAMMMKTSLLVSSSDLICQTHPKYQQILLMMMIWMGMIWDWLAGAEWIPRILPRASLNNAEQWPKLEHCLTRRATLWAAFSSGSNYSVMSY